MNDIIPIEFKDQRVMTTKVLAEAYGTDEKIISNNFNRNIERFIAGKHYYKLEGEELKEFKGCHLNDESLKYVSILYLWTDRGAARHAKILDTDEAWQVYEALEDTYFRVKENKPQCIEDILIAQLQEMKQLREQTTKALVTATQAQEEVQAIKDIIVINPKEEWRKQTNNILNQIGFKTKEYKKVKDEAYKALEDRAKCKLKIRLENLQGRALREGMAPSKVSQLNNLDVIANDVRLKEIYIAIVKEMAIKHGIQA